MNIERNYRFRIGLDVDDVLLPCSIQAVEWANRLEHIMPPLALDEVDAWTASGRARVIYKYFNQREFYLAQTPLPGACEFIRKLSRKGELFCVTAINPEFIDIRIKQIVSFFPEIKKENIIPAYRKDIIHLDFLLDDAAHNILKSTAKFPVLLRRPWNKNITGVLSANSYEEFLNMVDCIQKTYTEDGGLLFDKPTVIALVGPSGSGKTVIAEKLMENNAFKKLKTTTTRSKRPGEPDDAYNFISEDTFKAKLSDSKFLEHTIYAGNYYGTELDEIRNVLSSGRNCVVPIDITGAMALKAAFPTAIFFINRSREAIISALLQRVVDGECSVQEAATRICSIENEKANKEFADFIVSNDGKIEDAVNGIAATVLGEKQSFCNGVESTNKK